MLRFFRKRVKVIIWIVVIVFGATVFYGIGSSLFFRPRDNQVSGPEVLALVNGKPVDTTRYRQVLGQMYQEAGGVVRARQAALLQAIALEQAIDFTLMIEAAGKKVKVSREEVDESIRTQLEAQGKTVDSFREMLERSGVSWEMFWEAVAREARVEKWQQQVFADAEKALNEVDKEVDEAVKEQKKQEAWGEAVRALREGATIEVKEPIHAAFYHLQHGKMEQAEASFREAISQDAANPYPFLFLGQLKLTAGDLAAAEIQFQQASATPSGDAHFYYSLGLAYWDLFQKRREGETLSAGSLTQEEGEAIRTQLSRAARFAGDDMALHQALQDFYQANGFWPEAATQQKEIDRIEKLLAFQQEHAPPASAEKTPK